MHRGNFLPSHIRALPKPGIAPGPIALLRKTGKGMVPFCSGCQIIPASYLQLRQGNIKDRVKKKGKKSNTLLCLSDLGA